MVNDTLWKAGAALIASGASAGAFGAHALKQQLVQSGRLDAWHTGANYAIMNGAALLAISLHPRWGAVPTRWPGLSIAAGAATFSLTIFGCGFVFFSIRDLHLMNDRLILKPRPLGRILGPLTPVGGMAFIAGFVAMLFD